MIRPAQEADGQALIPLFEQYGRAMTSAEQKEFLVSFREKLKDRNCLIHVAEFDDDKIVGVLSMYWRKTLTYLRAPEAWIEILIVNTHHRKLGLGRRLIEQAITSAMENGCRRISLVASYRFEDAPHFYQAAGFEDHGLFFCKSL